MSDLASEPLTQRMPLHVETEIEGRDVRIALVGELTYSTVPLFTARLDDVLAPARSQLLVDVAGLHFCDSIGLSALIGAQRQLGLVGGEVVLSGVHGCLARTLSISGASVLFTSADPLERSEAAAAGSEHAEELA